MGNYPLLGERVKEVETFEHGEQGVLAGEKIKPQGFG